VFLHRKTQTNIFKQKNNSIMITTTIRNNRTATLAAAEFIDNNRVSAYIAMKGSNTYYNVNGIVWEAWQDGCGNYPTTDGVKVADFKI